MYRSKLMDEMRPFAIYIIIVIVYVAVISNTLIFITGYDLPSGSIATFIKTGSIEFAGVTRVIVPSIDQKSIPVPPFVYLNLAHFQVSPKLINFCSKLFWKNINLSRATVRTS